MNDMEDQTTYDRADANTTAGAALIPVPVPVQVRHASRVIVLTKLFSWMTAALLATSVLISLISVTNERDNLRDQLSDQSTVLACRSVANYDVSRASSQKDIAFAAHSVLVGEFVTTIIRLPVSDPSRTALLASLADELEVAGVVLKEAGDDLKVAVDAQEKAQTACNQG